VTRTDVASRANSAAPENVYDALIDPDALMAAAARRHERQIRALRRAGGRVVPTRPNLRRRIERDGQSNSRHGHCRGTILDLVPGVRVLSLVVVFLLMTAPRRGAHRSQQSPSGGLFFATDDVRAAYEELKDRGVEFQQEPTEQPYGIDRDPSGNQMRVAQLNPRGFRNSANPLWLGRFETRAFDSPKRIRRGPKRTGEKLTSTRSIRYSRARA
jgi:hypothetical protein